MNGSRAFNENTLTILRQLALCINSFYVDVCVYEGSRIPYYRKFRLLGHFIFVQYYFPIATYKVVLLKFFSKHELEFNFFCDTLLE